MRFLPLLALFGCNAPDHVFPEGFHWGSATAGFQVDMGCPTWSEADCTDDASDWYQWVTDESILDTPSLYVTGEPVSHGPGMWEMVEDDIAQMGDDNLNAYRFSFEWSRIFPDGAAETATTVDELVEHADADAVERYHEIFAAMASEDIHPVVTLNHYTMPLWVHNGVACHNDLETCAANGWIDGERITRLIGLYAGFCAREFGGEVDQWATLNEPFATTLSGYLLPGEDRSAPPGLSMNAPAVIASLQHQIEGHAAMYDAVHAEDDVDVDGDGENAAVGIVLNMVDIRPDDADDPEDVEGVEHADHIYHRLFLDGVTAGSWDDDLDGTFDRERPELADRLDWLGINYYNELVIKGLSFAILDEIPAFDLVPEFSWDPHPEGIAKVVAIGAEYGRPIYITENGTPHTDESREVLKAHLTELAGAIDDGADVRGYLYWSWVDNYEWNHGFDLRFGLYALDADTKERTARPVVELYRDIAKRNGIDD
ncbi:MAG: glycoside hydrolase family 1 protein [Proteobacteria bacterium]|nr:glycoside hydrolase family 1 protein [Pseudomonadota bacterium]